MAKGISTCIPNQINRSIQQLIFSVQYPIRVYVFSIQMPYIQVNARVYGLANNAKWLKGFPTLREEVSDKFW